MADIRRSRAIAADPQKIWDVLADFGAISSWADIVDHSCLLDHGVADGAIGTSRRIQLGRTTLVERIVEFDPPHTLAYDVEGLPPLVRRLRSRWTLRPIALGLTEVSLTSVVTVGSNPLQRIAERVFLRASVTRLNRLIACLAKELEGHRV